MRSDEPTVTIRVATASDVAASTSSAAAAAPSHMRTIGGSGGGGGGGGHDDVAMSSSVQITQDRPPRIKPSLMFVPPPVIA